MTGAPALTLLLVEDELLNRKLVKAILERIPDPRLRAAQLLEADTLAAARDLIARWPIDIVLLDIQLPDGSGLQLATELTTLPARQPRPIVIAVTAGALAQQHEAALAAGCDAILIKPFTVAELESVLATSVADPAESAI